MGGVDFRRGMAALAVVALALRLVAAAVRGPQGFYADGYVFFARLATSLAQGHGYALNGRETAFRVPVYPLFLWLTGGGNGAFWPVMVAQALVSTATVVLTGLIARRLFSPATGLLAAAMAAVWPYAVMHDMALQESGLFACLTLLATWLLLRLRDALDDGWRAGRSVALALVCGVTLGGALLTRSTLLPFALAAIGWLVWPGLGGVRLPRRVGHAVLVVAGLGLALTPWLAHSQRVLGGMALGTAGGMSLYVGNHPLTFSHYPHGSIDRSRDEVFAVMPSADRAQLRPLEELERDHWLRDRGLAAIREHPGRTLRYAGVKLWAAAGPWPSPRHGRVTNLLYAVGWVPLLALGLAGLWLSRRNWRRDSLFYLHAAAFALVTGVIWGHTSHKAYLDFMVMIFAAHALIASLITAANSARGRQVLARLGWPVPRGE